MTNLAIERGTKSLVNDKWFSLGGFQSFRVFDWNWFLGLLVLANQIQVHTHARAYGQFWPHRSRLKT
jgi:hypothetical protein